MTGTHARRPFPGRLCSDNEAVRYLRPSSRGRISPATIWLNWPVWMARRVAGRTIPTVPGSVPAPARPAAGS